MHALAALAVSQQTESLPFSVHLLSAARAWGSCGVKGALVRNSGGMPFGTLQEISTCRGGGEGMFA